jgi:hypothetical protein
MIYAYACVPKIYAFAYACVPMICAYDLCLCLSYA